MRQRIDAGVHLIEAALVAHGPHRVCPVDVLLDIRNALRMR